MEQLRVNRDKRQALKYYYLFNAVESSQDSLRDYVIKNIPEYWPSNPVFNNDGEPMVKWLSGDFDYLGYIGNQQLIWKYQGKVLELTGKEQKMAMDILIIADNCQDYGYSLATDVIQDDINDNPEYWDYTLDEFRQFIK